MQNKPKIRELINRVQQGDDDALALLMERIMPLVKKHSKRMGYDDSNSDLVLWVIQAVRRYRPRNTCCQQNTNGEMSKPDHKK